MKSFSQEIEFSGTDPEKMQGVFALMASRLPQPSFIEDADGNVSVRSGPHEVCLTMGKGDDFIRIKSREVHEEEDCGSCDKFLDVCDSLGDAKDSIVAAKAESECMSVVGAIGFVGLLAAVAVVLVFALSFFGR